jgi:DUF4097 and DUF4098 domain-containing protein YvlB
MKRASFVAPLLLIGIGVIFLIRNLYPNVPLMEYVGRYWPWVLIAWGGLRVIEIVIWKTQDKPLPAHGVSGGEWLLAVFICLFGSGLHAAQNFSSGFASGFPGQIRIDGMDLLGEPFEYPLTEVQKESSRAPHIVLENFRGDARISGNDTAQVKVTGRRMVRTIDRTQADRMNHSIAVEITGDTDNLVIRPHHEPAMEARRVTYNLEITVPKGARVEIHGQGGDFNVEDLAGVVLISERGDIRLRNISGPSQVNLRRGDIHVEAARVAGQVEISSGDVDASNVTGPLKISGRSGDVKVTNVTGAIDVDMTRGDLELRPVQVTGPIRAHSRAGDISLALPPSAQFSMDASTARGDMNSDFSELRADKSGRRGTIQGSVGKGPTVELRTERGDVAVRKSPVESGKAPLEKIEQ